MWEFGTIFFEVDCDPSYDVDKMHVLVSTLRTQEDERIAVKAYLIPIGAFAATHRRGDDEQWIGLADDELIEGIEAGEINIKLIRKGHG